MAHFWSSYQCDEEDQKWAITLKDDYGHRSRVLHRKRFRSLQSYHIHQASSIRNLSTFTAFLDHLIYDEDALNMPPERKSNVDRRHWRLECRKRLAAHIRKNHDSSDSF